MPALTDAGTHRRLAAAPTRRLLASSEDKYKEFQVGDVAANLLGSSLGLYIAYHLERYYRHRREVRHLVTSCAAVGIG